MKIDAMKIAVIALTLALVGSAAAQQPSPEESQHILGNIQASQIAANVPDDKDFTFLLKRDVASYFASHGTKNPKLTFERLRNEPTQSGVSYPKFYLWVTAVPAKGDALIGAMRVEAIEKLRFEVTDFVTIDQIRSEPEALSAIFPSLLLPAIAEKARNP